MSLEKRLTEPIYSLVRIAIVAIVILIALIFLKPFTIVDSGYRGLKFTMGKLQNEVLNEGPRFRWPLFQKIEEISIRPNQMNYTIAVGQDGAITSDNQNVGMDVNLFYRYMPDRLTEMWRDVGIDNFKNIAASAIKEAVKQHIGKYTIFDIAPIQEQIRKDTFTSLKTILAKYPVELTDLRITNYDWPDTFEKQIEQTMEIAQKVKQKQQDLLVAEQEAQKQVKQAEAQKTAMITVAEGKKIAAALDAEALALKGEGIKKYNTAVAVNMELEIRLRQLEIDKIKAEKWNGQNVPNNMYGPIPVSTTAGIQGVSQPSVK